MRLDLNDADRLARSGDCRPSVRAAGAEHDHRKAFAAAIAVGGGVECLAAAHRGKCLRQRIDKLRSRVTEPKAMCWNIMSARAMPYNQQLRATPV